jgi:hypothetical protein
MILFIPPENRRARYFSYDQQYAEFYGEFIFFTKLISNFKWGDSNHFWDYLIFVEPEIGTDFKMIIELVLVIFDKNLKVFHFPEFKK